jgi:hypothetical protein
MRTGYEVLELFSSIQRITRYSMPRYEPGNGNRSDLVLVTVVGAGAAHGPTDVATLGLVALTSSWRVSRFPPAAPRRSLRYKPFEEE